MKHIDKSCSQYSTGQLWSICSIRIPPKSVQGAGVINHKHELIELNEVPVERGTADFHYYAEEGVELPRVQVTRAELVKLVAQMETASRQYGSNDMVKATGLFRDSLKHIQAQQPAG